MPTNTTDDRHTNRRGILLRAAALGAAGIAAHAAGARGARAEGEAVTVGGVFQDAESITEVGGNYNGQVLSIFNNSEGAKTVALVARIADGFPAVSPAAIWGHSGHPSGDGVVGVTRASGKSGVFGANPGSAGFGVTGHSHGEAGVSGQNLANGDGVVGTAGSASGSGVVGRHLGSGFAVLADSRGPAAVRALNSGGGQGLSAESQGAGATVEGLNRSSGPAVKGSASAGEPAVVGLALGVGAGVFGAATEAAAVWGRNDGTADGVRGSASGPDSAAVRGVQAGSGAGVHGEASSGGVGVRAVASGAAGAADGASTPGVALDVSGINRFTQVGRGAFEAGNRQQIIEDVVATANSGILVTLNGVPGPGIFLEHARVNSTTGRVVVRLSDAPRRRVPFTYFIVDAQAP